jgi:hypothetical protein
MLVGLIVTICLIRVSRQDLAGAGTQQMTTTE